MSVRKRLQNQQQITTEEKQCNFSDEIDVSITPKSDTVKDLIPSKYFLGTTNLKTLLPEYQERRRTLKSDKYENYWLSKINECLDLYDPKNDKYFFDLCKCVMQIVEKYMIYTDKCGLSKKKVVMQILLPYFDNNEELLSKTIENQMQHIQKSSFLRRLLTKLEIFFYVG
jgi:hypothetical protein